MNADAQPVFTVLIADDHPDAREGIRDIVTADPSFRIAGEAVNGKEAVELSERLQPDLILMDIRMPVMDGMEATKRIKANHPRIKIIMVTVSDDVADLFEAIKMGAQGYLLKNLNPASWHHYLRAVAFDEAPVSKEMAGRMLREFAGALGRTEAAGSVRKPAPRDVSSPLTAREREVLERVAQGMSNRHVAESLGLSENTVKNHLKNILQKLHLNNRVQLARYAMEQGLTDAGREP